VGDAWPRLADPEQFAFEVVGSQESIVAFTTRADTLPGVTYVVVAPEHALVGKLVSKEQRSAVEAYVAAARSKSDRDRTEAKSKTGVALGASARNPVNGEEVPIWVADYVIATYGTGAVMAVPAHDERDHEFARAYGLPIVQVIAPRSGEPIDVQAAAYTNDDDDAVTYQQRTRIPVPDDVATAKAREQVTAWLAGQGKGRAKVTYRLRDWVFARQRYWGEPIPIYFPVTCDGDPRAPGAKFTVHYDQPLPVPDGELPLRLPDLDDFKPGNDPAGPLARAVDWRFFQKNGKWFARETNTMPQWAGSCWYYLRYLDPANDQQFVDSTIEEFWMGSPDGQERAGGVDLYIGGVEHAVLHLLYARFWHKILADLGYVSTPEPFQRLYNQGYILADAFTDESGRYVPAAEVTAARDGFAYHGEPVFRQAGKMGKSLKNSVSPDEMYESYGADTLRMYEMAMGPLDADRPWQPDDIAGVYRFLQRLWRNIVDEQDGETRVSDVPMADTDPLGRLLHRTISEVSGLLAEMRYNVAVARLTGLNNAAGQFVQKNGRCPRAVAEALVLMTFPLAPHITSELWERLGHRDPVDDTPFPVADPAALAEAQVVIPVTVDGRPRGTITVDRNADESEVLAAGLGVEVVARLVAGRELARVVFVPGKILNLVTRPAAAGAPRP